MTKKTKRYIRNGAIGLVIFFILIITGGYLLAKMYKNEILAEVNRSISDKISGTLEIKDIDFTVLHNFPSFSLTLQDAVLRDSLYPVHHVELFHAKKITLQLILRRLLLGELKLKSITISDASVSLVKMKNGYSNTSIIRKNSAAPKDTASQSSFTASIDKVLWKNVQFSMVDSAKNKWFKIQFKDLEQKLDMSPAHINDKMTGTIYFGGLAFNADKGSYLTNKTVKVELNADFNIAEKKLTLTSSTLEVDKKKLLLRGNFTFSDTSHMHLEIDAPDISVEQANSIVTQHIAAKLIVFKFEKPLIAAIRIDGPLYPGSKPAVDVFFKTTDNVLSMKTKTFTEVNALGWFMNHADSTQINDDHNSKVILARFNANLGGIPIKSKVAITDLIKPSMLMNANVNMDLAEVYGIVDTSKFLFNSGKLDIAFKYDGKLMEYVDTITNRFLAEITGSVHLSNASFEYVPRRFVFSDVNAVMLFGDSMLKINELRMKVNENAISVTGQVIHFIPFLFVPGQSLFADLMVKAGVINFNNFASDTKAAKTAPKKSAGKKKKSSQKQINNSIDNIFKTMQADILLEADKIISGKFSASDIGGHIVMNEDFLRFNNLQMNTSGGTFLLNGGITSLQKAPYKMAITASIGNADISSLFYSFNNFNQKAITNDNLKGRLTANINFSSLLKKDYAVDPQSMRGTIKMSIRNGALVNLEGLDKISEYVFKNRDFSNIEFAQLKDTITINGQKMTLSRMQIQSNVATLYVEGTYGFNGGTDISIQIPLSNLKKRGKDYKPTNVSADTKLGASVFLRMRDGADGKIQVAYDPLKDYYKDKDLASDSSQNTVAGENKNSNSALPADSTEEKKNKKKQKK